MLNPLQSPSIPLYPSKQKLIINKDIKKQTILREGYTSITYQISAPILLNLFKKMIENCGLDIVSTPSFSNELQLRINYSTAMNTTFTKINELDKKLLALVNHWNLKTLE